MNKDYDRALERCGHFKQRDACPSLMNVVVEVMHTLNLPYGSRHDRRNCRGRNAPTCSENCAGITWT